jgi:DNA recombination protein RmuC
MLETLVILVVILAAVSVAISLVLLRRTQPLSIEPVLTAITGLERGLERIERGVRDEIAHGREESTAQAKQLRDEVHNVLKGLNDSLIRTLSELTAAQKSQLDAFAAQLLKLTDMHQAHAKHLREEMNASIKAFNDSVLKQITDLVALEKAQLEAFSGQLAKLTESNEKKLEALRETVDARLKAMQEDNTGKLEQMRATVDEKLQGTLEKRLGESFKLVSERLEQVHRGLGDMQNLAAGVGDLKRVLTNVKTRGTWGEIQLGALLEQVLSPEQYDTNVATKGDRERVEFAVRLPGRGQDAGEVVWLPIDAKYPQEDYQRLVDAQDRGDAEAADRARKELESSIRKCAKDICDKYINPPNTTDFAIMFLPTEGLYAEVIRQTGLTDVIQRDCRVVVAGPTTLTALLNSLQMGFRTLAIQKRSSEVWKLLAAVKTEFGKFGSTLESVKKKLDEAANHIDKAASKSRTIERRLSKVEELPAGEAQLLLPDGDGDLDREIEPVA